jgi:peptide/nickel transport system permease protein
MKIRDFHLFIVKRFVYSIFTILVVATMVYAATYLLPGDAAMMILGRGARQESIVALEQQLGLDQPIYIAYLDWLTNALVGDFGTSLSLNEPVMEIVIPRAIVSFQLAVTSLLITILIAIPLAVFTATRRGSAWAQTATTFSYFGVSIPEFVTGSLLVLLLGGPIFGILPSQGFEPMSEGLIEWAYHIILPVITLTIILIAHILRQTRSELIEVLQSEYIRTARLKGLDERTVLFRHGLPNGLLPTITILAIFFGYLMGGLVVVESIFALPGLGRLVVYAIENRDLPLLQAAVLIIAASYTIANLFADISYSILDPRIGYEDDES